MKVDTVSSLGYELKTSVPETVEEFDNLAKKPGVCLSLAISNVQYRSILNVFRDKFTEALENQTNIKRLTEPTGKTTKDEAGVETPVERWAESEQKYFNRVLAELVKEGKFASVEAAASSFADLAQSIIDTIAFNPAETERNPSGPKKIAAMYIKIAQKAHDDGKLPLLVEKLSSVLGSTWKIEETVDSVSRAISENERRKREAAAASAEYAV